MRQVKENPFTTPTVGIGGHQFLILDRGRRSLAYCWSKGMGIKTSCSRSELRIGQ